MITLYGIKNCDTVKKARRWLEEHGIDYQFHDFRQDGVVHKQISEWVEQSGWEAIVNKRSTTWRGLTDKDKNIKSNQQAADLLFLNPTLIKRPITQSNKTLLIGFKNSEFQKLL